MSRTPEKVAMFEAASLAAVGRQVVIGGVTYYRVPIATYLPWASRFCFHTVKWCPRVSHLGATLADPPVAAATVGAGAVVAPARCSIWLVEVGGIVPSTANLTAEGNALTLYPGDSVDLGGWFGDLLLAEGPGGKADETWDWTDANHQAALGPCFGVVIDQAITLGAPSSVTVLP